MKTVTSLLLVLILTCVAFGQTEKNTSDKKVKPDFSGTWILDRTKGKKVGYDLTLIVAHREPELKITAKFDSKGEKRIEEKIYYTDDRRLPDFKEDYHDVLQESSWAGKSILLKTTRRQRGDGSSDGFSASRLKNGKFPKTEKL